MIKTTKKNNKNVEKYTQRNKMSRYGEVFKFKFNWTV